MASRKVPVHRGNTAAASAARSAPHPGVSGTNGAASNFQSPYQPPSGDADFRGSVAALDPDSWQTVLVAGTAWRVKIPGPSAIGLLADMATAKGGTRVKVINGFLAMHMHPDDLHAMLLRMSDPDGQFTQDDYIALYRAAVTLGTARPFPQSSHSLALLPTAGEPSEQSSLWEGYRRH